MPTVEVYVLRGNVCETRLSLSAGIGQFCCFCVQLIAENRQINLTGQFILGIETKMKGNKSGFLNRSKRLSKVDNYEN